LLIVCDTDSGLDGIERDAEAMRSALVAGIPDERLYRIVTFQGAQVEPRKILEYYQRLAVGPDDTLAFYYTGHGATDPNRGHCLTTERGPLFRQDLRAALVAKGARLVVLLTDCCSSVVRIEAHPQAPAPRFPEREPQPINPLLRNLFLEHRGVVDITAATEPQAAYANNLIGGFFTNALSQQLFSYDGRAADQNQDGFVTWTELFAPIRDATHEVYRSFRNEVLRNAFRYSGPMVSAVQQQESQTPHAWSLGERVGSALADFHAPNLGLYFRPEAYRGALGLRVTRPLLSGSPLAPWRIGTGDLIVEMDGLPLRHPVDVLTHVGVTSLVVLPAQNGQPLRVQATLPLQVAAPPWAPPEHQASNLGIFYRLISIGEGAFGARLSRMPVPGSPLAGLRLEIGDMLLELDDLPILGTADVVNHVGRTTVRFVDIRSGETRRDEIVLPGQAPP
jgi:hypothetical protein